MASDPNEDIQRNHIEARQGTSRPKVIYVLIGGVVLVVIAFLIVMATTRGAHAPT